MLPRRTVLPGINRIYIPRNLVADIRCFNTSPCDPHRGGEMELYAQNGVHWAVIRGVLSFYLELKCLAVPACLLRLSYG